MPRMTKSRRRKHTPEGFYNSLKQTTPEKITAQIIMAVTTQHPDWERDCNNISSETIKFRVLEFANAVLSRLDLKPTRY